MSHGDDPIGLGVQDETCLKHEKSPNWRKLEKETRWKALKTTDLPNSPFRVKRKLRALVSLAMETVAKVQGWTEGEKPKSRAECEAELSIAMTLAKTAETSARRVKLTVKGLVTQFSKDSRETLASIRASMTEAGSNMGPAEGVAVMVSSLAAEGVENLGYLEAYARKGKPGLAAAKAEAEAKIAEAEARAVMTEAEAAGAAKTAEAEAAEAAADQTPRAKAAKQAAAILASIAKHGQMMTTEELQAIAGGAGEWLLARLSVAADKCAADIAADVSAKAEAKAARLAA